jgi:hypothetical protein
MREAASRGVTAETGAAAVHKKARTNAGILIAAHYNIRARREGGTGSADLATAARLGYHSDA